MKCKLYNISAEQVDQMIRIKWGKYNPDPNSHAYVSNAVIGKIYGIDASSVWWLYINRFREMKNMKIRTRR